MKISEVYQKYNVPPNLVDHMLLVTKIALTITDNWVGEKLDKNEIERSALVHDLGNIVRFDFDKHPEFLGNEIKNIELWKERQREMIQKYGMDDHEVTKKILNELGYSDKSIEVVSSKSFVESVAALNSNNWSLKILLYSDMRVSPNGITSLEVRLEEVISRRPDLAGRPDINILCGACRTVEKQIQSNVNISLNKIDLNVNQIKSEDLLNTTVVL